MELVEIQQAIGKKFIGKKIVQEVFLKKQYREILIPLFKMPLPFLERRDKNNTIISKLYMPVVKN